MPRFWRILSATVVIAQLTSAALGGEILQPTLPETGRFAAMNSISTELLKEANRGRNIFDSEGYFAFPPQVNRVWVDVGAHLLETTIAELLTTEDMGLIAIEPMPQAWKKWVDNKRLIALPIAVYLERGERDFYVTQKDARSSLAKGLEGAKYAQGRETVEVLSVPVLRLEDVLSRIPANLPITYLKTDVQSLDLQVLKSGGKELERVLRVQTEVINDQRYEELDGHRSGTEEEFVEYMQTRGFRFVRDLGVADNREYLNKEFINVAHPRYRQ